MTNFGTEMDRQQWEQASRQGETNNRLRDLRWPALLSR